MRQRSIIVGFTYFGILFDTSPAGRGAVRTGLVFYVQRMFVDAAALSLKNRKHLTSISTIVCDSY
jgi:hypothetical protein